MSDGSGGSPGGTLGWRLVSALSRTFTKEQLILADVGSGDTGDGSGRSGRSGRGEERPGASASASRPARQRSRSRSNSRSGASSEVRALQQQLAAALDAMRDMQHRIETLEASVAVLEGAPSAPDAPAPASCSSARSSTASQGVAPS